MENKNLMMAVRKDSAPLRLKSSSLLDTCVVYCGDWHASHFVKVMLDQIFGEN